MALATLALSWPLLQLLGDNAEFFLSRRSPKGDVISLVLAIGFGIPVIAAVLGLWPTRRGGRRSWQILVGVLAACLTRLLLRNQPFGDPAITALATVVGALVSVILVRSTSARSVARYLLISPLVVTILFFFATPTGSVVRASGNLIGTAVNPAVPHPVVIIGFDEFPVASLMRSDGSLNTSRYPNFARLAADGVWFRNAVGVEQQTELAYPAILTGVLPGDAPPFADEYPNNIFSLLSGSYDETVTEAITQLCPEYVCGDQSPRLRYHLRLKSLFDDTTVVAGHLLLPEVLSRHLPSIDGTWGGFGSAETEEFSAVTEFREEMTDDRRNAIAELVAAIGQPRVRPFFGFLHVLIPHHPWQYLPTGQAYPLVAEKSPGTTRTGWGDDQWLLDQGTQRHLLQVGYADRALGEVITALESAGIYDDAIVVVVADHGIAIKRNVEHQRVITEETIGQIAAIPLFIKGPGMTRGVVDDRRAETTDILPTIADILDITIPWETDGVSLLGEVDRDSSTMSGPQGSITFGVDGLEKFEVAKDIATAFPTGDPYELVPPGAPTVEAASRFPLTSDVESVRWRLDRPEWYVDVDPGAPVIPARITGRLDGTDKPVLLAIEVNGKIGAIVRSYTDDKGIDRFQAMIGPSLLATGDNFIALYEIRGDELVWLPRS